jgi:hypothetical protein
MIPMTNRNKLTDAQELELRILNGDHPGLYEGLERLGLVEWVDDLGCYLITPAGKSYLARSKSTRKT